MLRVRGLNKSYKRSEHLQDRVLKDINLTIKEGEFVAILGESGSGKSTLLNVVSGLDTYDSGNVIYKGVSTKYFSRDQWASYRNNHVALIFQEHHLIDHLSAVENIELPLLLQGISKKSARIQALDWCERLGLKHHHHKLPKHLSGGQAKRVSIARALITNPSILLADEPIGSLNQEQSKLILDIFNTLSNRYGVTVILVTHDEEYAHEYANRIITLEDGRITNDCYEEELLKYNKNLLLKKASMKRTLLWNFARNNIRKRKFRTLLTSSIMSIGLIAVFLILFLVNGIRDEVNSVVSAKQLSNQYIVKPEVKGGIIRDETIKMIREQSDVSEAYYNVTVHPLTNQKAEELSINEEETITFYKPDYFGLVSIPVKKEHFIKQTQLHGQYPTSNNEVIITSAMAQKILSIRHKETDLDQLLNSMQSEVVEVKRIAHSKEYSTFKHLMLIPKSDHLRVVGIIDSEDYMVYALHTKLDEYVNKYLDPYDGTLGIPKPNIKVDHELTVFLKEPSTEKITLLEQELAVSDLMLINPLERMQDTVNQYIDFLLYSLLITASMSLLVAGILVALIVYMSVLERKKEIGILFAIGATRSNVKSLFLIESIYIGVVSISIALVISVVGSVFLNTLFNKTLGTVIKTFNIEFIQGITLFQINWNGIIIVFLACISATSLLGYVPATIASKLKLRDVLQMD